jgi:hypothetical protein
LAELAPLVQQKMPQSQKATLHTAAARLGLRPEVKAQAPLAQWSLDI